MISEINTEINLNHIDNCECDICSICLSPRKIEKYICPKCKNKFHLICIIKWFNKSNTCPICRTKINSIKLTDQINNLNNFNDIVTTNQVVNEINYSDNLFRMCKGVCFTILTIIIIIILVLIILSKI